MTDDTSEDITYWKIASSFMAAPHSIRAACEAVTMTDIALIGNILQPRSVYDEYRAGMPDDELEERLSTADITEKIVAYGCGGVPKSVAEKRWVKASKLEKGLIYTYCRGVYEANRHDKRTEKTEHTENQAWMISDLPGM